MEMLSADDLIHASNLLFGTKEVVISSFLRGMAEEEIRNAFRKKALQTHPDRAAALGKDREELAGMFREVVSAYEVLLQGCAQNWQAFDHLGSAVAPADQARPGAPAGWPGADARRARAHHPRAQARTSGPAREPHDRFYQGQMPRRPLLFSEFLYYSQVVPWRPFIDSICWQRRQRPRLGDLAQSFGILDREMAARIARQCRPLEKFGDCAVRKGCMTRFWLKVLLRCQQKKQPLIGEYFIKHGLASAHELECCNQKRLAHNSQFQTANYSDY